MPETVVAPEPVETPAVKSRVERTHGLIHTISMTLGIVGAVGAAGVWLAANLCVGDVEIQTDKPTEAVVVKVYDKRGQEATYHIKRFQLMPGSYHLEVTPDGNKAQHADIAVKFAQKCVVPVTIMAGMSGNSDDVRNGTGKRHWWQFWRK